MRKFNEFIDGIQTTPAVLLKTSLSIFLCSAATLLLTIVGCLAVEMPSSFLLFGLGLFAIVFLFATNMLYTFAMKKYTVFDGVVIDSYGKGMLKWRKLEIVFAADDNETYSFSTKNFRFRLLAGDRVSVYCPEDTMIDDVNGVNVITSYYAFARHK